MLPHVAQHIRREKLRVQPSYDPSTPPPQLDFSAPDSSFFNPFEPSSAAWKPDWILPCSAESHFPSLPFNPYSSLHEAMSSSTPTLASQAGSDLSPLPPPPRFDTGNELLLLPSYNSGSGWTTKSYSDTQRLSLSLASNPPQEIHPAQLGSIGDRWLPIQGIGGGRQAAGPLGPFTGYAAILKSSRFLKPAQQLLDEFCGLVSGARVGKDNDSSSSLAISSPSLQSSTEIAGVEGSGGCHGGEIKWPEFEQKKAKLLYMQEEVCKRYKQYHQQIQMVVSSFESVAGLSSATPYASLALKAVSKHFRCLKSAISDQLRHVCNILGEEMMASSPCSSRNDTLTVSKLKYIAQSVRRQKGGGDSSISFSDNSHPIWRPQRGLPERAVSVLRAWLFDHFLHPYPTDTDKHMLATQTGLSRNQVSNWFINARVRLWKPMVEEIHTLETKGIAGMDLNSSTKTIHQASINQQLEAQSSKHVDVSASGTATIEKSSHCLEQWHQEKRSRIEDCAMDAGLMSFAYQGGMEIGSLSAVSLTLGLRQGEDFQQEQQMRHFGHQMLHDFVG
ncbi:BEL1-like homeodomain protein 9 [Phalaenopsis equestris]|uniref:BEL1-like homeodomain protein 9 n=1 Tax=Phalaenopsis equestris TaxID=78828 RepID=UPI0009E3F52C|nr:BEL1-like homeodomain protein 9 [Phalaenopsis equestris]